MTQKTNVCRLMETPQESNFVKRAARWEWSYCFSAWCTQFSKWCFLKAFTSPLTNKWVMLLATIYYQPLSCCSCHKTQLNFKNSEEKTAKWLTNTCSLVISNRNMISWKLAHNSSQGSNAIIQQTAETFWFSISEAWSSVIFPLLISPIDIFSDDSYS